MKKNSLNSLEKVAALEHEAEKFGFCWENTAQIMAQISSECSEVEEHLNDPNPARDKLQEEIGDLLHAVFSLCVFCQFEPAETLNNSLDKFERRLNAVKQLAADQQLVDLKSHTFDELMDLWHRAKRLVG